jgi:hypothetical protein
MNKFYKLCNIYCVFYFHVNPMNLNCLHLVPKVNRKYSPKLTEVEMQHACVGEIGGSSQK